MINLGTRRDQELQYLKERNAEIDSLLSQVFDDDEVSEIGKVDIFDSMLVGVIPDNVMPVKGFFSPTAVVSLSGSSILVKDLEGGAATIKKDSVLDFFQSKLDVKVPVLLPSTRNENVPGQAKLLVDIALSLDHMRPSDKVIVVGGYSQHRGGNAYRLLAGFVESVDLYDPNFPNNYEEPVFANNRMTKFRYHASCWDSKVIAECDVFFNDAFVRDDGEKRCVEIRTTARYYSIKRFHRDKKMFSDSFRYDQIRRTGTKEWREVSERRFPSHYLGMFGTCPMCREIDYFSSGTAFNSTFRRAWSCLHPYELKNCTVATTGRAYDARYVNLEIKSVTVRPIYSYISDDPVLKWEPEFDGKGKILDRKNAVGMIPIGSLHDIARKYIDFTVCEAGSSRFYTTSPIGNALSNEVITGKFDLRPGLIMGNKIVIGTRVFGFNVVFARKECEMASGTEMICFDKFYPMLVSGLVILDGGAVLHKFSHWRTLDKFVWSVVKGSR